MSVQMKWSSYGSPSSEHRDQGMACLLHLVAGISLGCCSVAFKKLAELLNTLMAQLGSDSMETARLPCAGAQRLVAPVTDLVNSS